jgi:hypothetical protein
VRPREFRALAPLQRAILADVSGRRARNARAHARVFAPPPQGDIERRWHIYAAGYLARVVEALENDYPALRRILGSGPFRSLAARYVQRFPTRSFDIGRTGERLPEFLEGDALRAELPFLADLARFEWALAEAFVSAEAEPLRWATLAASRAEAVADMTFRLRPGSAVVRSPWPLRELHGTTALADHEISVALDGRGETLLVYREGLEVRRRDLDEQDAEFLERAQTGIRLSDLAADETNAPAVVGRFRRWVEEGSFEEPEALREGGASVIEEER